MQSHKEMQISTLKLKLHKRLKILASMQGQHYNNKIAPFLYSYAYIISIFGQEPNKNWLHFGGKNGKLMCKLEKKSR
jgi:hypothetical protein